MSHAWWYHSHLSESFEDPHGCMAIPPLGSPWLTHHQCEPLKSSQVGSRMQHVWNHQPINTYPKKMCSIPKLIEVAYTWCYPVGNHLCWIFETNNHFKVASNIAMFKESVPMVPSGVATWPKGSLMRVWSFKESWTKGNSTKTIQDYPSFPQAIYICFEL